MPEIEGVRKVNEWVMKNGRTLVITDNTVPVGDVPNGTLFTDPSGSYSENAKQLMIKQTGTLGWSILDPVNIFKQGSIVNSLIGTGAVHTENIYKGAVTRNALDDSSIGYTVDNALYVNPSNAVVVDRSSAIAMNIFGDFTLVDKVASGAAKINRTFTVEGKINANSDITSQTAIKSALDISAGRNIIAKGTISSSDSISATNAISAGTDVSAKTLTISSTGTITTSLTIGQQVLGVDKGSLKVVGTIDATQAITCSNLTSSLDMSCGNNLTVTKSATVSGALNANANVKVGTTLEVGGAITGHGALTLDGAMTAQGNIISATGTVTAYGDIISNNGNISTKVGTVGAYGDIVSSNGNITSTNGTVYAGNGMTIKKGGLTVIADGANITGNVTVTGTISADRVFNGVLGDLAEGYVPAEETEPGDILEITDDFKVKRASVASTRVIGVHSKCFANCFMATKQEIKSGKKVAVGLIGQAPIKIVGKAYIGDLIVSAGSGIGRAIQRAQFVPGTVVGKVIENKDYEGLGLVMCYIFPA